MKKVFKNSKLLIIIALVVIIVPLFMVNINANNNGVTVKGYNEATYTIESTNNNSFVVKKNGTVQEDKTIQFRKN